VIKKRALLAIAASLVALSAAAPTASAQSCYDLWYERNSIFANYGYCFSTKLGRETFGNSDCHTRNPRLSGRDSRRVANIKQRERRRGCRVNR